MVEIYCFEFCSPNIIKSFKNPNWNTSNLITLNESLAREINWQYSNLFQYRKGIDQEILDDTDTVRKEISDRMDSYIDVHGFDIRCDQLKGETFAVVVLHEKLYQGSWT